MVPVQWLTPILLVLSNVFMTYAWYGHLKHKEMPLWKAVVISWGIAFFEYLIMIPANRMGYTLYSASQLKIIQEAITLLVFAVFAVFYLGEHLKWNMIVAFMLILAAVFFAFYDWK
jgi:uncharacterized protein (DUF486 family)